MTDAFSKLIEKCIELLRERARRQKETFEIAIRPIYEEMTVLVEDYLKIFNHAAKTIRIAKIHKGLSYKMTKEEAAKARESFDEFLDVLKNQREQLKHRRVAVEGFAAALLEQSSDFYAFANEVKNFFHFHAPTNEFSIPDDPRDSSARIIIEVFSGFAEKVQMDKHGRLTLHTDFDIDVTIRKMEESWMKITIEYSKLRRKMLSLDA